jgi:hypothetical protein
MMLILLMTLAASPHAPAGAELVTFIPRLEALATVLPFFEAAGARSTLLRPESWRTDAHPLIDVDITSPSALALVGIDPKGSLTRSRQGESTATCLKLTDLDAYRRACDAKLARLGEVFEKVEAGVPVYATRDALGRVLAAYTVSGKESCAMSGHGRSIESQLPALARMLKTGAAVAAYGFAAKLAAPVQFIVPNGQTVGAIGLTGQHLTLNLEGKTKGAPLAQVSGAGKSPFGTFKAAGMAVVRARVAKPQLPALIDRVVRVLPQSPGLAPVAKAIVPYLTGNVAALAGEVRVTNGLRTPQARYFAVKSALLVEVTDAAAVEGLLTKLDLKPFPQGTLSIELSGTTLVVSNDAQVKATAVAALSKAAGKQSHGVEFELDPKLVAEGLSRVPLLEALQTPELAALVAASSELGPLLSASASISGFLDSAAGDQHSGAMKWELEAKAPPSGP